MSRRLTNSYLLAISSITLAVVGVVYFCIELLCFRGPSEQEILSQYENRGDLVTIEVGDPTVVKLSNGHEVEVYELESINQWVMPWSTFEWNDTRLILIDTISNENDQNKPHATHPILRFDGIKVNTEEIPDDILQALEQANRYPSH